MKLEVGKTYVTAAGYVVPIEISEGAWLTAGGYVVELTHDVDGGWATLKTSAGTSGGITPSERRTAEGRGKGWFYNKNGRVRGLDGDWDEKLRIVEKLPFKLPELPSGYKWVGDFPQFRIPEYREEYLGMSSPDCLVKRDTFDGSVCDIPPINAFGKRRLIVEKLPFDKLAPLELPPPREQEVTLNQKIIKPEAIPFSGPARYELMNGQIVHLGADQTCLASDGIKDEYGDMNRWRWCRDGDIDGLGFDDHSHLYLKRKLDTHVPVGSTMELYQEKLGDVNVLEKTPTIATRVANYFIVGPAKGIYRVAKESMGYIVFVGLISSAIYTCYNPSLVMSFVKSCIPHISISVEKPEVLNNVPQKL